MKRFLLFLTLLFTLSETRAQEAPTAPPVTRKIPSTYTKDGLTITPVELKTDDVAGMLEINFWGFRIEKPTPSQLDYRLELRRPEKEPIRITTGLTSLSQEEELSFGLMPEEGQTVSNTKTFKIYLRSQAMKNDGVGSSMSRGRYVNPMRELAFSGSELYSLGQTRSDGSIVLMRFSTNEKESVEKSELVLVLTAKAPEPPKPQKPREAPPLRAVFALGRGESLSRRGE